MRALVCVLLAATLAASCGPSGHRVVAGAPVPAVPAAASAAPAPPPPFPPPDWPFHADDPAPHASHGMVVTDAALATKVGADMLAAGGNAVDAATAAAFALAVVFPSAGNVGGGGFLVARVGGKSYALDFRETAPSAASRDMYLGPDGKATQDTKVGYRSAGVPGTVAGLWEAWQKLGSKKKTWTEVLAPAIELADRGFAVDAAFAKTVTLVQPKLAKFPASASLFLPGGSPPPSERRGRIPTWPRSCDASPPGGRRGSTRVPRPTPSTAR